MRAFISTDAPEFETDKRIDAEYTSKMCEQLSSFVRGGTLILFTSYADLNRTAEYLEKSELLKGRKILVQGKMSRAETVGEFMRCGNAILLGTDTFWTGIDVPGESLSQVIITRLPFDNISHPLSQARMERAQAEGVNAFQEISLPAAIIKFRQGIGRLIRNKTDKGIIAVLDSRMTSKSYGRNFVDAIPTNKVERFSFENINSVVKPEVKSLLG